MREVRKFDAFLLSREWRDADDGVEIVLWARAPEGVVRARIPRQEAVMFVTRDVPARAHRRDPRPLATLDGRPVDALYFRAQRALLAERDRLREAGHETFESDVKPSERFLMERFVTGGLSVEGPCRERRGVLHVESPRVRHADVTPALSVLALDLETDDLDGPILSAAIATRDHEEVFLRLPADAPPPAALPAHVSLVPDEATLLRRLFETVARLDPDVICGWNVVEFDLTVLDARCRHAGVPFTLGRGGERARVLPPREPGASPSFARVPGRVVLDGIATLRSATYGFERYTLEHVARELLGRGKTLGEVEDPLAEIRRMWREAPDALVAYNLEDCRLVLDVFAAADLVAFAVERARLTGLPMDRQGGSVAAFDHLYLPRLHRRGFVARDVDAEIEVTPSPGGQVLESVPGLYRDVVAFDFRSLYPSIVRTYRIDPLGLAQPGDDPVPGEDGASFARGPAILPDIVATLHEARARTLAAKNAPLSRAIKIVMNSFYGVLGTPGCRFFDPRLPTSITRRGHEIIDRARRFFEDQGLAVVYGDTDSLFVVMPEADETAIGARARELAATFTEELAQAIREESGLESFLELRFDAHYLRFLMPTTRGSDRGSKKRYAGTVRKDGRIELVVRGLEAVRRDWTPLARRVQLELLRRVLTGEPFEEWLRGIVRDLHAGRLDDELVHRKQFGDDYVARQLAPVCDVVLPFVGTSFERVAGAQTSLF